MGPPSARQVPKAGRRISLPRRICAETDQQFAEIPTLQEPYEGFRRVVEPFDDVLPVSELTILHERRRQRAELAVTLPLVTYDEALDAEPLANRRHQIGAGSRGRIVVFGDHAAHDHSAEIVKARKDRVLHVTADILEINVDTFGACPSERGLPDRGCDDRALHRSQVRPRHSGTFRPRRRYR